MTKLGIFLQRQNNYFKLELTFPNEALSDDQVCQRLQENINCFSTQTLIFYQASKQKERNRCPCWFQNALSPLARLPFLGGERKERDRYVRLWLQESTSSREHLRLRARCWECVPLVIPPFPHSSEVYQKHR